MKFAFCSILLAAVTRLLPAAVTIQQFHTYDFSFKAQAAGNPFQVELKGEFIGPGGARIVVPGFYDGDNTWKIRFSPTLTGSWSMRTTSPVAALNGQSEPAITAIANSTPAIHGGLRVDPLHRKHFIYEDGTRYFLMGYEADWLWGADMLDPQRKVMHRLIDQMAGRGFNHVLVNVFAYDTGWARGRSSEWDYGPPAMFVFGGTNDKPDHAHLNTDFFKIYDGMMAALQEKGIVANLMLKVYNKMVNWPAAGSPEEEQYFRYVTARYQAFSNVTWDFSKEAYNERDKDLQKRLIDLIRSTDGYRRLTTVHDNDVYDWDPNLNSNLDFRTDQEHQNWERQVLFDHALRQWPVINSELYYERGVDDIPTYGQKSDWQETIRGAYQVYLSGGYFAYYYSNTAWDVVKPDPEPPGMQRFQLLKESLSSLPYWRMDARPDLAASGDCLAAPGEVYVFYVQPPAGRGGGAGGGATGGRGGGVVRGGEITVNLTALDGPGTVQWINTWTGERAADKVDRPGVYQLTRPASFGAAPGLLIVRRKE